MMTSTLTSTTITTRTDMKKIPMRRCVVTHESLPKKELLRIVKNKEGEVFVDTTGKANGKGAYIKKDTEVLALAKKRKALEKALDIEIEETVYEEIARVINGG